MQATPRPLFDRYHLRVYRYFLGNVGQASAEELTQEVFLRVIKGLPAYEPLGREAAWVFTIARRVLLDFRKQSHVRLVETGLDESLQSSREATQFTRVGVREALVELPDSQRDAFLLRELGGLSYAEIADLRDTTVAAVRSMIHRARQALRARLTGGRYRSGGDHVEKETIGK